MLKSHFSKQLHARGIARHSPEVIEAKGRADVDALAAFLGDRPFLLRDRPSTADAAVFGQLAPMVYWPMATPVASYARSVEPIADYCERMRKLCFARKSMAA
jgi:glutathione S-transferase